MTALWPIALVFAWPGDLNGDGRENLTDYAVLQVRDDTETVQAVLDAGGRLPYIGRPYIVRPLQLRSGRVVAIAPGVVIEARPGALRGPKDRLLSGNAVSGVTLHGYGATLRMHRDDYAAAPYEPSEQRHCLALLGVNNVVVRGLNLEDCGGDGIYVSQYAGGPSVAVQVLDCTTRRCYRQGMSVISVVDLYVHNCRFLETCGTPPQCGIDVEPAHPYDKLINVVFADCQVIDNAGGGIAVSLRFLDQRSSPVSVRVVNCLIRSPRAFGILAFSGPKGSPGLVDFRGITVDGTNKPRAALVTWPSTTGLSVEVAR